jgi:hypothetical protein
MHETSHIKIVLAFDVNWCTSWSIIKKEPFIKYWSHDGSVSVVSGHGTEWIGLHTQYRRKIIFFTTVSTPHLEPTNPPSKWILVTDSRGRTRLMLEADLHLMRTKSIYEGFLVDTVALGQVFSPNTTFLGAFATLRKTTIGFVMSVRPQVTTQPPLNVFWLNL